MSALARNLGASAANCWAALDPANERPDWLPRYIKNVLMGRTHRQNGQPYDEDFLESTWQILRELNTNDDLAPTLAARQGSEALAKQLFDDDVVATLTGRLRAHPTYPQARNTPFQGLAADGAKLALFRLVDAGYRVVAFIHDEFLIELPETADHTSDAKRIYAICCAAMQELTGDVPIACGEPALTRAWSKDAKAIHDVSGKLLVWEPKAASDVSVTIDNE